MQDGTALQCSVTDEAHAECKLFASDWEGVDNLGQTAYNPDRVLESYYWDAGEIAKRVDEVLKEAALKEVKGTAFTDYTQGDMSVIYTPDKITVTVTRDIFGWGDDGTPIYSFENPGICCHLTYGNNKNTCTGYDSNEYMSRTILINIHFTKVSLLPNSKLNQVGDMFEVCSKAPMMVDGGELKAVKADFNDYNLQISIPIDYYSYCQESDDLNNVKPSADLAVQSFMEVDESSLTFALNTPCDSIPDQTDKSYKPQCAGSGYRYITRPEYLACTECHDTYGCYIDDGEGINTPSHCDITCPGLSDATQSPDYSALHGLCKFTSA